MGVCINSGSRACNVDGEAIAFNWATDAVTSSLIPYEVVDECSPSVLPIDESRIDSRVDRECSCLRGRGGYRLAACWGRQDSFRGLREKCSGRGSRGGGKG